MEGGEQIVVLEREAQVRKGRHERLARVLLIASSLIVHAVLERLVGGSRVPSLQGRLDIERQMPTVVHKTDSGRVEIRSLNSYDGILGRIPQESHILICVRDIAAGLGGESGGANSGRKYNHSFHLVEFYCNFRNKCRVYPHIYK